MSELKMIHLVWASHHLGPQALLSRPLLLVLDLQWILGVQEVQVDLKVAQPE